MINPPMTRHTWLIMILSAFMIGACADFLTDVTPADSLPLDNGLDNPKSLQSFLEGSYAFLATPNGDRLLVTTDLMTSDTEQPAACWVDFAENNIQPSNIDVRIIWNTYYSVINQANIVIERVQDLHLKNEISDEEADRMTGEALFLRAVMHFELVRVFALPLHKNSIGIPLITAGTASTDALTFPERNPVSEVYNQVQLDLTEATMLLSAENNYGKATKFAAMAYNARVLFQIEEYEAASLMLIKIIDSATYELTQTPEEYFRMKGTVEDIWSVVHSTNESGLLYLSTNGESTIVCAFGLALDAYDRIYSLAITEKQWQELQANGWKGQDQRFTQLTNSDTSRLHSDKYPDPSNGDNNPVIRYAEVLLMYAECMARQGSTQRAIDYLNMIRTRAILVTDSEGNVVDGGSESIKYQLEDFSSDSELIEAIILERQIEFMMEGNRFHDLIRLRRDVNGLAYDHDMLRYPIPISELDANPNLVPNPGY